MLIIVHLSLMSAAVLCIIAGVGVAMFGRKKRNWLTLHKRINTAGAAGLLIGATMALANVMVSDEHHLAGLHQWFGLAAITLGVLTLYLGFYSFKARNKAYVRAIHRRVGRGAILFMLAAITLGLNLIGVF